MSRTARAWLGGGFTLLLFVLLAWIVGALLQAEGARLWWLRGGFVVLGLIAAGIAARLLWVTGPVPRDEGPDDETLALKAAQARLARSSAPASKLSRLPLNLVIGPRGSTKTTLIARTGLDPELLAGEVVRDDTVVETDGLNLWYRDGTVYVEAGGALLEDETRWARLARAMRPSRWAAAIGRGRQAPRSVVVCFGADEFLKPGAREAVQGQARLLRQRIATLTEALGVSLPVYVLFTKADRFPFFLDYVRTLTSDEVQEPLGATLPLRERLDPGSYGEEEGGRVRAAFEELQRSLAANRLRVLPRETEEETRGGAYELPRELRKVSDLATSFLVELCRPSQLGVSPVLRGFYLTGVRPVVVRDVDAGAEVPQPTGGGEPQVGATGVFDASRLRAQARERPRQAAGGARRIPQWVFLERFFRDLLAGDTTARALTAGGARVDAIRRFALAGISAVALVLMIGLTVSFFGNRALGARVAEAAAGVAAMDAQAGVPPSADRLESLEALRAELALLRGYVQEGPPRRLRWGLFQGEELLAAARPLYFQRFDELLWASTRARLVAGLDALEGEPGEGDDYGRTYDALRAYLVTTRHPERSDPAFLTPALLAHWPYEGEVDEERRALARAQFDFFASELAVDPPSLLETADDRRVATARSFLQRFAELDRVYQALLSSGAGGLEPVDFSRVASGAAGTVRNDFVVPGAFTEEGWGRVQGALDDVEGLFAAEAWVVGEQAISAEDRARLAAELRARYETDYVAHWQGFLEAASVPGFGGVAEAARRLDVLSGNQSPVLQVLALTSRNTAVDSTVATAFQPVHQASPPDVRDRFISEANEPYMAGLVSLHAAMDQLASATGSRRDQLAGDAASSAEEAKLAIRSLAQDFSVEGEAQVAAVQVQRLMEAPVNYAEALITRLPVAEVNQGGQAFCSAFSPVLQRYPFDRGASAEASMDDLTTLFGPGDGVLWSFYDDVGQGLLARQGSRFVPAPGASPAPTDQFVSFFNRAAQISRAFFGEQGGDPEVAFAFRPETSAQLPSVTVSVDGQTNTFTRTMAAAYTFVWEGARARNVRVTGEVGGEEVTLLEAPEGPWALFRLFGDARWEEIGEGRYRLTWPIPGRQLDLAAEVSLARGVPVFRADFLDGLSCVSQVAR